MSATPAGPSWSASARRPTRRIIRSGTSDALTRTAVANYIAKYATKTADAPGLPAYRLRSAAEVEALRCPPHYRRLIETAWAARLPAMGALPRLRRPLPHQVPPLLRHLRPAPHRTHANTAARSATQTASSTPGAGRSTKPPSYSSATGTTPDPATRHPTLTPWPSCPPTTHVAIENVSRETSEMPGRERRRECLKRKTPTDRLLTVDQVA